MELIFKKLFIFFLIISKKLFLSLSFFYLLLLCVYLRSIGLEVNSLVFLFCIIHGCFSFIFVLEDYIYNKFCKYLFITFICFISIKLIFFLGL